MAAYGTDFFPAFYSPASDCVAPCRVDSPEEAASLIAAAAKLGMQSGLVLGVPIPEEHMSDGAEVEQAIRTSLTEASNRGVSGNEVGKLLSCPVSPIFSPAVSPMLIAMQATPPPITPRNCCALQVTPFLLKRIAELTSGRSLQANIHLVKNNAAVGARIAVALAAQGSN